MTQKRYNYVFSISMLILAVCVYYSADKFPKGTMRQGFGAGIYPMLLACVIAICALSVLVRTIYDKTPDKEIEELKLKNLKAPAAFFLLLMGFCILLRPLGLLLASFLYMFIGSKVLFKTKLWKSLLISIIVPSLVWAVFVLAMKVPFPSGHIWRVLGFGG